MHGFLGSPRFPELQGYILLCCLNMVALLEKMLIFPKVTFVTPSTKVPTGVHGGPCQKSFVHYNKFVRNIFYNHFKMHEPSLFSLHRPHCSPFIRPHFQSSLWWSVEAYCCLRKVSNRKEYWIQHTINGGHWEFPHP